MNKNALRKHFRQLRSRIPQAYHAEAALRAAGLFKNAALFAASEHIACYLASKEEFNTAEMIQTILQTKKKCYLPVITSYQKKFIKFVQYHEGDFLRPNAYHILEPAEDAKAIYPKQLDLVILPLLAFDRKGGRLGTGGGYYDRAFSFLRETSIKMPVLMGLGFAEQAVDKVPLSSFDVLLNFVLTEKEIIFCKDYD